MTLTEFLLARLTEDEFELDDRGWCEEPPFTLLRMKAECDAKRAVVTLHHDERGGFDETCSDDEHDVLPSECDTLRALASVYRDHRDYNLDWA